MGVPCPLGPKSGCPGQWFWPREHPAQETVPGPLSLQVRMAGLGPMQKWGWPSSTCRFRAWPACLWEQCPHSDTGPRVQHVEQPTLLLRFPACQPWWSPTPRHLGWFMEARGCGWGHPGGSSPLYCCPDRSVSLLPQEQGPTLQSWFPSWCPPRGVVQGGHSHQTGRVCGLYTARRGRAGCLLYRSARLQLCTQPLPGLRDTAAELVPELNWCLTGAPWAGRGHSLALLAFVGVAGLPCTLRRDLLGLGHRSTVLQPSDPGAPQVPPCTVAQVVGLS